jgi:hypothetical protein
VLSVSLSLMLALCAVGKFAVGKIVVGEFDSLCTVGKLASQ